MNYTTNTKFYSKIKYSQVVRYPLNTGHYATWISQFSTQELWVLYY